MRSLKGVVMAFGLVWIFGPAALSAVVELRGRAMVPSPTGNTVQVTVKVTIKSFSTAEEV